jgi:hypothetical protein
MEVIITQNQMVQQDLRCLENTFYEVPSLSFIENVTLIENPYRSGSCGTIDPNTGKSKEILRIDPATPTGKPGPEYSHYHLNGGPEHFSPRRGGRDPWPW